jgi:hypothetical protein
MQFAENVQANWQEGHCFIMTMPDPIQPEKPRRGFKNYSGNFLNNCLTARTWSLVTSICSVCQKTTLVGKVSLMTKRLKRRCGSGRQQSRDFHAAGFD